MKSICGKVYKNALQLSVYSEGQLQRSNFEILSESTLKKSASGAYRGEEQLQRNNFEDFFQNVLKKRFYRVLIGVKG